MLVYFELEIPRDSEFQRIKLWSKAVDEATGKGAGFAIFGKIPSVWVAKIVGSDPKFAFQREFMEYRRDVSRSNSKMTRGVFAVFFLMEGSFYEVNPIFEERYFIRVHNGNVDRVDRVSVIEWINHGNRSEGRARN